MANQLSEYVVKILDRVRTHDELELVLNKTGKPSEEKYSTLARLKLAVQYGQKRVSITWTQLVGNKKFLNVLEAFTNFPNAEKRSQKSSQTKVFANLSI